MQDFIERITKNFLDMFSNLAPARKMGFVALTCIIIATMVSVVIWASKTQYEILYTDLNKEDSAQIAILLKEKNISYQLSKDGKVIHIPGDMVDTWRLKLAMQGVSFSGTVGYEVFDKQSFGTTTFVQKVNRQRALEGELIKTIKYIKGVRRARVHLSIPDNSPFVSEKKPPSASVILDFYDGRSLTSAEIKGIASLVSSAVNEMRPENVVILDHRGKKLSENIGDPLTEYTANRIALETKLNRGYEKRVEEMLGKVVGDGKVIAKVNVQMDFTESVSTETKYDSENRAVVSEVINTQRLKGARPSPQGIPGARSNLPGEKPQPGIPETRNDVDKRLSTRNYSNPTRITKSKTPTAGIKRISVAVMVDGKRIPTTDEKGNAVMGKDGNQVMKYEPWSEADIASFKSVVTRAIGIDDKRGDSVVIENMEFAQEDLATIEAMMRQKENRKLILSIVKYLAVGLTITLFFFLVVRPFVQWVTDNTVESIEDFLPKTLEELEKIQSNQKLPGLEEALPQIEEKINPEKIEGNMLREKIISLVENDPSKAAQVVRDMIHSQDSNKEIA
ncbi:MAG: flagellar M-ring protein FliF [Bacteriovoracaceae bacterium]|nr:flagellar M-ring protein FliF [Bacteriovoracaceae bacterium]